jgi:uroporphyrinogen-III decarboxylase
MSCASGGTCPLRFFPGGTVQEVKDDVRRLIDIFGDSGGLIIDGSCGLPDQARRENVFALTEAVHEYGTP